MSKLTIGMACANDWQGLWSTLLILREVNRFDGEIVVIDNDPTTNEGKSVAANAREWGVKYVAYDQKHGTSQPRNEVFRQATGDYVLCIDSHIYIPDLPILTAKIESGELGPDTLQDDLFSGPLIFGPNLYTGAGQSGFATHFADEWGSDAMWGKWGTAWAPVSDRGAMFEPIQGPDGMITYRTVGMNPQPIAPKNWLPTGPYEGYVLRLKQAGFAPLGVFEDDPAFEIPAMGLGLFLTRRDSWLGFHPLARGFGGEEITIHEYYRDHGRKCWCLPWLKWHHRFAAEKSNPGYAMNRKDRARNYALNVGRLKDKDKYWPKTAEAMTAFIGAKAWDEIAADPDKECASCAKSTTLPFENFEAGEMLQFVKNQKRDFDQQVENLLVALDGMKEIVNVVKRKEWDIVTCVTGAKVTSFNREIESKIINRLKTLFGENFHPVGPRWPKSIPETDALILDTEPTAQRLFADLEMYASAVRSRILIHATQQHGEKDGDQAGLLPGLRFWLKQNPDWVVVQHSAVQYGLTVISREKRDKKPLPSIIQQGINFASAMSAHVASGMKAATEEKATLRLETCALCPIKNGDRCAACGCVLSIKATLDSSECPIGYWAQAEEAGHPIVPPSLGS